MENRSASRRLRLAASRTASLAAAVLGFVSIGEARVTQINITAVESPTFSGASFGTVGQYERIEGTFTGEVDPKNPLNADIVDIGLAPKNAHGKVSYSADFQILRPIDLSKGNHRVIFELPNRGRTNILGILNDSQTANDTTKSGNPGNGFVMNQGYTIVEGGWDISAAHGSNLFTVTFPIAKHKDGSTITGPATEEFVIDATADPATRPASEPLTYPAATADKSKAFLTVRENYADKPIMLDASAWDYTDSSLTAVKLTSGNFGDSGSFGPTALYEFTYIAKDPVVAGLGFASLRDLATFLREAKADDNGVNNPLAGDVRHIYTFCSSQPCRTTRDFLLFGFNQPEAASDKNFFRHEVVFDSILNWKGGGSGIFMNYRFAQPGRTHRQHIARWTPEIQFPFADLAIFDRVTGKYGGRLDRCRVSHTCPKIFEANSANEYWAKAGSVLTTDGQRRDLPLDETPNVRYYLFSSFPHGAGTAAGICQQPQNPLAPNQLLRALLLDLDDWVSTGHEPPPNSVPRLADETLVPALPQSGMGFPNIPAVVYNGVHHTGDLWDFGPRFDDGILSILPPKSLGTPYQIYVPKTDSDGNDIAGIRTPDVSVPVATYTGWALRAETTPQLADGCDASGQRLPFAKTKTARMASGDPRLSLEERYKDHATYVNLVTAAAQKLKNERLLLDTDAQGYIAAAQAAAVP
jgi:hypothetical protein